MVIAFVHKNLERNQNFKGGFWKKKAILDYVRFWEIKFSCGRFDSVIQQEEWRAMKKLINLYRQPLTSIPISYFKMSDADTEA